MASSESDKCPSCGKMTAEGEKKWRERCKPIYGTDLSKPLSQIIEENRCQLAHIRGQLSDIAFAKPGWEERLRAAQGNITCTISYLHGVMEEMKKFEQEKLKEDGAL